MLLGDRSVKPPFLALPDHQWDSCPHGVTQSSGQQPHLSSGISMPPQGWPPLLLLTPTSSLSPPSLFHIDINGGFSCL